MSDALPTSPDRDQDERLERQAEHERAARREAEAIAERSLRHLYAQKERLALLQALAATANAAANSEDAKREALRLIGEHTGWPVGHVYRRRGDRLVPLAFWSASGSGRFAGWRGVMEGRSFREGEGLPGRVLASGRPTWIRDVAEDAGFLRGAEAARHGLRAALAFPVLVGEEVAAVLEFFSEQAEEPDEALLEMMAYAGAQLGYAVERNRLRRSHELILGAAGEGLYGLDADGRATFVNPATAAMVGSTPDALLGTIPHEVFHHHRADGTPYPAEDCPIHQMLRDGEERRVTGEVFWRRDGTSFPVEYVATPIREGDGIVGAVVAFHDVSERVELTALREAQAALLEAQRELAEANRRLEDRVHERTAELAAVVEALQTSEAQLQKAQQIAHVGSWRWDVAGDRVEWSDEMYRIFGMAPGEAEIDFAGYTARLHPDDRALVEQVIQSGMEAQQPYEVTHRIVGPEGAVRWVHSHGEPVLEGGELVALQGTAQDVTAMKRAEAELKRNAAELEESNEELQKFAYVASHDLQEPLRMVTSFLQLLERRYEGELDETALQYIGFAVDGARRMQALIKDLLTYSRVGTHGGSFEAVDANTVVQTVLRDLGPALEDVGGRVEVGDLPTVHADPTQFHQLLLNLVSNAIKFRRPDAPPVIRISAEQAALDRDRAGWRFAVADNGIGIEPQYADRVFNVFQRLHTREEYEGTGIGLAVCKKIVERHGGEITFAPVPGGGTTFRFTLPLAPPPRS